MAGKGSEIGKSFEEIYFKAMSEKNLDALSKIIMIFAEDEDSGLQAFDKSEEVYDFIDDYMEQNQKNYSDIFEDIAKDINEMGFFNKKMTEEELKNKMENYMTIDMNEIVKNSAENAFSKVVQKEFMGYKG